MIDADTGGASQVETASGKMSPSLFRKPESALDKLLEIHPDQQTSSELRRLGCLLAVFLPFELTAWLLQQLSGIQVSDDTIWNWVQAAGQQAVEGLKLQLQQLGEGQSIQVESLNETLLTMPLIIAADGITVPLRPQPKTAKQNCVARGESSTPSTSGQLSDQNRQNCNSFASTSIGGKSRRY